MGKKAENAYSQIQVLEQQKQDEIDLADYWKQQLTTVKNSISSDGYTQPYLEQMVEESTKGLKANLMHLIKKLLYSKRKLTTIRIFP